MTAGSERAVLDRSVLDELVDTFDGEFVGELISTFLASAPGMLTDLRQGGTVGDAAVVQRAAHTLKSNAASLGATRLSELCRSAEGRARAEPPQLAEVDSLITEIADEYGRVASALDEVRREQAGGT